MSKSIATSAIIPASGLGRRLTSDTYKAFVSLLGRPLIAHTLDTFQKCPAISEIVLVVPPERVSHAEDLVKEFAFTKVRAVAPGGKVRQDSVRNGLAKISSNCEIVVIHDGARPLVRCDTITKSIEAAVADGAATVAVPVVDTIKVSNDGFYVSTTLDRSNLYAVQTPQTFRREVIEQAYEQAYVDGYIGTDDASLVERLGLPVRIVEGSYENIKITTPVDLVVAESLLSKRQNTISTHNLGKTGEEQSFGNTPTTTKSRLDLRVGHGYDIHRFTTGRKLFLGGVEFENEEGLAGHSDADVMLHAVADALLGAIGAGDIGKLFPDTDPTYKDIRSTILLAHVGELLESRGWQIGNIDITLIAQRPRIAQHTNLMSSAIAEALKISPQQINIKATTAEGLGAVGQGLGIECHAVATVFRVT